MSHRIICLAFVISLLCWPTHSVGGQSPLLNLMKKTRKEVAERPYNYVATATTTNRTTGKIDFKFTDDASAIPGKYFTWRRTVDHALGLKQTSEGHGLNSRYLFHMSKKAGASGWILREVKTHEAAQSDPNPLKSTT